MAMCNMNNLLQSCDVTFQHDRLTFVHQSQSESHPDCSDMRDNCPISEEI